MLLPLCISLVFSLNGILLLKDPRSMFVMINAGTTAAESAVVRDLDKMRRITERTQITWG